MQSFTVDSPIHVAGEPKYKVTRTAEITLSQPDSRGWEANLICIYTRPK